MTLRSPRRTASSLSLLGASVLIAAACGGDKRTLTAPPAPFDTVDAGTCLDRCSLDGRSILRCSGEIEACPTELACGGGSCKEPCDAAAIDGSTDGCAFFMQPPVIEPTGHTPFGCYAAYIVNTSTIPAEVELEFEGEALDVSNAMYRTVPGDTQLVRHEGPLAPGDGVVLFVSDAPESSAGIRCPSEVVPALVRDFVPQGTEIGSAFHLKTSAPVSAATIFPYGGAISQYPSATILLPVASWSNENILITPWEGTFRFSPGVQIVASEDDTDVTLIAKADIRLGAGVEPARAGVPTTYRLQKGQFLQIVQAEELTGSLVTSTKPTSTFAAHSCAMIPAHVGACDTIGTQITAFERWGSEYVAAGYRPRTQDTLEPMPYRIVAARDGTRLDYDPEVPRGAPLTLNAGESATFAAGVGEPFVVRTQDAEHPIYVGAYMSGANGDYWDSGRSWKRMGDPEFIGVPPSEQYLTQASFFADPTYAHSSLTIVRSKTDGEFKDVILDCLGGPVSDFKPIGTRGTFEYAHVDLSISRQPVEYADGKSCHYGAHRLTSEGLFTASIWGWDIHASYAYPSGMSMRKLISTPLVPK